jgi:hypothetical protein
VNPEPRIGGTKAFRPRFHQQFNEKMEPKMADRETIIDPGGGGSAGLIAGIVVVVVLVLGFLWFLNNNGGGSGTVDVDVPAVTVDVQPDGQ